LIYVAAGFSLRLEFRGLRLDFCSGGMKRVFDLVLVVGFIPFWGPVVLAVALLVRVKLGSPVLFRQARPGRHGRIFELWKFRTMTDRRDDQGGLLPDAQRLTPFGRWLRSTSLDELPELVNVLKGEMSLVGPRPLLVQYLDRYTSEQARRHDVRPGLTGWVQVNGRNTLTWADKFKLDVWYVDHQSLGLDIRILALTFLKVFRREGISAAGDATMPEFMGNSEERSLEKRKAESEKRKLGHS
jgi:sugar transferase EpsL